MSRNLQSHQPSKSGTSIEGLYKTTYTVEFGGLSTEQELKPLLPSETVSIDPERSVYMSLDRSGPKLSAAGLISLLDRADLGRLDGNEKLFTAQNCGGNSTRYNKEDIANRFTKSMSESIRNGSKSFQLYFGPDKEKLTICAVREKTHDFDGGTGVHLINDKKVPGARAAQYLDPDDANTRIKDLRIDATQSMTAAPWSLNSTQFVATQPMTAPWPLNASQFNATQPMSAPWPLNASQLNVTQPMTAPWSSNSSQFNATQPLTAPWPSNASQFNP